MQPAVTELAALRLPCLCEVAVCERPAPSPQHVDLPRHRHLHLRVQEVRPPVGLCPPGGAAGRRGLLLARSAAVLSLPGWHGSAEALAAGVAFPGVWGFSLRRPLQLQSQGADVSEFTLHEEQNRG